MSTKTEYKKAIKQLRKIASKKDFSAAGDKEYWAVFSKVARLRLKACLEQYK